ncbi:MAG: phosphatase PAP2 family protein [Flavobacteriales bacterium]|nr:phosphatase PAP2 family protein [Flavobacteriales bacterium]MCB9184725.1 phosphatase PAP2 family protein [Flavobacteriales bacterium]
MSLWQDLDALDRSAFLAINGAHTGPLDLLMEGASEMILWFPLYAFFLWLIIKRHGDKAMLWSLPLIGLMILCSDKGSVMLFKETVQRLRPCHEPALAGLVHLVPEGCGGQFGFVSSHASNHFAIAVFMIGVLRCTPRWAVAALLAWAGLIAYSRVYLGVHYPGDVLVGALYGAMIGSLGVLIFRRFVLKARTSAA